MPVVPPAFSITNQDFSSDLSALFIPDTPPRLFRILCLNIIVPREFRVYKVKRMVCVPIIKVQNLPDNSLKFRSWHALLRSNITQRRGAAKLEVASPVIKNTENRVAILAKALSCCVDSVSLQEWQRPPRRIDWHKSFVAPRLCVINILLDVNNIKHA